MTDNEIIKALERCFTLGFDKSTCYECPFYTATAKCTEDLRDSTLDLINRQKAENKELRSDKIIAERHEKDARELFVDCKRQLDEAKAEIENLKRGVTFNFTIEDFESIKETVISRLDNKIKSEAIKEFAKRLKEKLQWDVEFDNKLVFESDIDNLVKEMTEVKSLKVL